ncbi:MULTISPECIES: hypothetical protein [unclassified Streptococcus]|uniref:hypothetical protein n=1 Tax=unclassified Streptococcus TaxID=2608887 RepID=UPI00211B2B2B|nr:MULTISPECIES: hypothetical protein [unclassified Streptococcus]MCQ9212526.1 hypothetical protein [Streptococcus sp. B01]MCQ9213865.1 hypothetical protein [Streptococcus sp. O1]
MKFLTENDLRVEYHNFPFDTFTIPKNSRLTPGARTFLIDRKIRIIDEDEQTGKSRGISLQKKEIPKAKERSNLLATVHQTEWFAIRCELLKTACDLASTDTALAEELKIIERSLACAGINEDHGLPPITMVNTDTVQMDKEAIIGNLSIVGMLLQTNKGRVLTRLYPLYFRLEAWVGQLEGIAQSYLLKNYSSLRTADCLLSKRERGG